jgi:hypothetical protein
MDLDEGDIAVAGSAKSGGVRMVSFGPSSALTRLLARYILLLLAWALSEGQLPRFPLCEKFQVPFISIGIHGRTGPIPG